MRIGIDARMYRSGVAGIGRYSQNLIKNLLEIDRENQYVLFMTNEDLKEFKASLSQKDVRFIGAPRRTVGASNALATHFLLPNSPNHKIVITEIPHYSIAEQTRLPKIIEKENLDLMHFLHFNVPLRYRGKFIVTIHDLTLLFYPEAARDLNFIKHLGFRYVLKNAIGHAAAIIAVSENTKKDIVKKMSIDAEKIQVIYEAADDKINIKYQISNIKIKEKYHIKGPVILYVGQFRGHKNIEGLIQAFQILQRKIPAKLVLLGGKKEDLVVDISALKRDIVMPGFVSDEELASWYKNASVFVMPSFYEGFGLPGLEAMEAGTPVAASNNSSLPEIYREAAVYFDPFKVDDIADKIKEVIGNKELRKKLIENSRKVSKEYSWRKTAEETLELYKQLEKS